ncbi:MAG: endonuclease/exonuclease/phosphatase family protein [Verrucomicrobiota bacterium]
MSERKLITFNIAHGRGLSLYQGFHSPTGILRQLERITRLLSRFHPDIVCLQEVDEASYWNGNINLLQEIQNKESLPYSYLGVHNRREGSKQLAYGNAILSRYPIREAKTVPFGKQKLGEKGFVFARIEFPEGLVSVLNLHLDFRSRVKRLEQVEQVIRFLHKELDSPGDPLIHRPIICGDFNSRAAMRRDAVAQLFGYMKSHHEYELYPKKARSFPAHSPVKCIDFIFLPQPMECNACQTVRSYVSDHRPVFMKFEIPEPGLTQEQ